MVDVLEFSIQVHLLCRNVQRFREGLVIEAHGLLYQSTLGLRVIKKKKKKHSKSNVIKEDTRDGNDGDLCEVAVVFRGSWNVNPWRVPETLGPDNAFLKLIAPL